MDGHDLVQLHDKEPGLNLPNRQLAATQFDPDFSRARGQRASGVPGRTPGSLRLWLLLRGVQPAPRCSFRGHPRTRTPVSSVFPAPAGSGTDLWCSVHHWPVAHARGANPLRVFREPCGLEPRAPLRFPTREATTSTLVSSALRVASSGVLPLASAAPGSSITIRSQLPEGNPASWVVRAVGWI